VNERFDSGGGQSRPQPARDDTSLVRHEEEAHVDKRWQPTGYARVRREVEQETVRADYPRERDELNLERVPAGENDSGKIETLPDGSISVPPVAGHAANGMKGSFGVGVTSPPTTTTQTTTVGTNPGSGGQVCTNPTTTVNVSMLEYRFVLDKTTIPAGCTKFVITNNGAETHNFDITGVHGGQVLSPGVSETWSVVMTTGPRNYVCDVPFHVDRGMVGTLTVT